MQVLVDKANDINKEVNIRETVAADRFNATRFSVICTGTITAGEPVLEISHDSIHWVPYLDEAGEPVVLEEGKVYGVDMTSGYIRVNMTNVLSSDLYVSIA